MKEEICSLLDIADRTFYKWKQEKRPIIQFLAMFNEADLNRYLDDPDNMSKYDLVLDGAPPLLYDELILISGVLTKLEFYIKEKKLNREGILIKFYRTLRDMPDNEKDYIQYLKNYKMPRKEAWINVMPFASFDELIGFYDDYLSSKEINIIRKQKKYILPPLKSMRQHNTDQKD